MGGNPQAVQSHPMLTPSYANMPGQMAALPQIFTNAAGQLVTLGPQIIAHPMMGSSPTNLMVNPQVAAAQLQQVQQQDEKGSNLATVSSSGQPTTINRIQNSSLNAISQAIAMQQQQPQSAQMALNPVTIVTTQLTSPVKNQPLSQNCVVAPKLAGQPGTTVSTLTQTVHP
ncbi:hypothetical protein X975_12242, partial [Stegodyphus mimosarum]